MRTLIQNRDLKTLVGGVAIAAASGLLLGGVMQPNLHADALGGPQTLMPASGVREARTETDPGLSRYAGRIPDHVVGADWTKPPVVEAQAPLSDQGEAVVYTSEEDLRPIQVTRGAPREPAPEPVAYPSDRGGVYYETDLPRPPAAPDETDTF